MGETLKKILYILIYCKYYGFICFKPEFEGGYLNLELFVSRIKRNPFVSDYLLIIYKSPLIIYLFISISFPYIGDLMSNLHPFSYLISAIFYPSWIIIAFFFFFPLTTFSKSSKPLKLKDILFILSLLLTKS